MIKLLLAMGGGAAGSGLRYGVYMLAAKATDRFPLGTLLVYLVLPIIDRMGREVVRLMIRYDHAPV